MDIIIYAQELKMDTPCDLYYKNRYVDKNKGEIVDLNAFFRKIEILNYSREKSVLKVRAERDKITNNYLYLYVPCEERDDIGRYSPIIIQAYHKDVNKIFDALDEFLEKSNRHITERSRMEIKEKIKNFKNKRIITYVLYLSLIFVFLSLIFFSLK